MTSQNKTHTVRNQVFRAILQGSYEPGSRLPPEREMALTTGTSRVTVRRAYEELQAAGIVERTPGSGTYVAESFGGNTDAAGPIALLAGIDSRFALGFIRALEAAVAEADQILVLRLTDDRSELEEAAAIDLVAKGIRNLVLWPSGKSFPEKTFARLRVLGVNLVLFDRVLPGSYADFVGLDNVAAIDLLFIQAERDGLADPIFMGHSDVEADSDRSREAAYRRNCEQRGLPARVVTVPEKNRIASHLPDNLTPASSIFCVNDAMAMSLVPHLPAGARLYGVDGLTQTICSCQQPLPAMAKAVVELLQRQRKLGAGWEPTHRTFPGTLINAISNPRH